MSSVTFGRVFFFYILKHTQLPRQRTTNIVYKNKNHATCSLNTSVRLPPSGRMHSCVTKGSKWLHTNKMWVLEKGTEDYSSVAHQLFRGNLREYSSIQLLFALEKFLKRSIAGKAKGILANHTTRPQCLWRDHKRIVFIFTNFNMNQQLKRLAKQSVLTFQICVSYPRFLVMHEEAFTSDNLIKSAHYMKI